MIPRPTTAQLLRDCRRELTEVIGPELASETAAVSIQQLDQILENCAVRAAHEIAWMVDETATGLAWAADVAEAHPDDTDLAAAVERARAEATGELDLESVCDDHNLANAAMGSAMERCVAADDRTRLDAGLALLRTRTEREAKVLECWGLVGRG